jgi:hypothetical protein
VDLPKASGDGWTIGVLPPATTTPEVGYAEFAGWVPAAGNARAREASDGKYKRFSNCCASTR